MRRAVPACLALVAILASLPSPARACAGVGRRGLVPITGERALIVWDPETRTEHFVRTAAFADAPEDFAFLVPTPSEPELTEVDDIFGELFAMVRTHRYDSRGGTLGGGVTLVRRQVVAGMDAAVLRASDAGALARWLRRHRFARSRALRSWLRKYVRRGWYVTAFRLRPEEVGASAETRVLRMSFETPKPVYPYSEPASAEQEPRPLRVYVAAPRRMEARRGDQRWLEPAFARDFEGERDRRFRELLARAVPEDAAQRAKWLTVFDEPESRRGRRDLTFREAGEQAPVVSTLRRRVVLSGEWRPRPSPRMVSFGEVDVRRRAGLERSIVERVLRRRRRRLFRCYEQGLQRQPTLTGSMTIQLLIGPSGDVPATSVRASDMSSAPLESCVHRELRGWRFPAAERVTIVRLPIRFGPEPEEDD